MVELLDLNESVQCDSIDALLPPGCQINQAVDVLHLWDRLWFGGAGRSQPKKKRPRRGNGPMNTASRSGQHGIFRYRSIGGQLLDSGARQHARVVRAPAKGRMHAESARKRNSADERSERDQRNAFGKTECRQGNTTDDVQSIALQERGKIDAAVCDNREDGLLSEIKLEGAKRAEMIISWKCADKVDGAVGDDVQRNMHVMSSYKGNDNANGDVMEFPGERNTWGEEADLVQELPGIGTWAGRQQLFPIFNRSSSKDIKTNECDQFKGQKMSEDRVEPSPGRENRSYFYPSSTSLEGTHRAGRKRGSVILPQAPDGAPHQNEFRNDGVKNENIVDNESGGSSSLRYENEAWKWRFCRKWEAEQRRMVNFDRVGVFSDTSDELDEEDALAYAQACGFGITLQVDKPRSRNIKSKIEKPLQSLNKSHNCHMDGSKAIKAGLGGVGQATTKFTDLNVCDNSASVSESCQFEIDQSYNSYGCVLDCGEEEGKWASETPSGPLSFAYRSIKSEQEISGLTCQTNSSCRATEELLSMACEAQKLVELQKEIEQAASATWRTPSSSAFPWVGNFLSTVEIDMSGSFAFMILRIQSQGTSPIQRMLLRGHKDFTVESLLKYCLISIMKTSREHRLPPPRIFLIGCGRMEWRRDTERHLIVSPLSVRMDSTSLDKNALINCVLKDRRFLREDISYLLKTDDLETPQLQRKESAFDNASSLAASLVRQVLPCHFTVSCLS